MSALKAHFNYRKFDSPPYKILYLDNNYFLQKQSIRALHEMGHKVLTLTVEDNAQIMLDKVLKAAVGFKPDCIISMNHEGFDKEGKIAAVLEELSLPVLIWYLDDFRFILPNFQNQVHENIIIFTFEKANIPFFREAGFHQVYYLPTATMLEEKNVKFSSGSVTGNDMIVFVGNSFEDTKRRWYRTGYETFREEVHDTIPLTVFGNAFIDLLCNIQRDRFPSDQDFFHYCGYAAADATQRYRVLMLKRLHAFPICVYGDGYWSTLLQGMEIKSGVDPEQEAPAVYRAAGININLSSTQLQSAVNLRVFDVPASGGFLLTDWRESLAELFDEKHELAVFHDADEAHKICDFYIRHPRSRNKIMAKARERVFKEHRLNQRLEKMLSKAGDLFG
jgi:spore maturation protein CgeB